MYALCFVVCLILGFFLTWVFLKYQEHLFHKTKSQMTTRKAELEKLLDSETKLRQMLQLSE